MEERTNFMSDKGDQWLSSSKQYFTWLFRY